MYTVWVVDSGVKHDTLPPVKVTELYLDLLTSQSYWISGMNLGIWISTSLRTTGIAVYVIHAIFSSVEVERKNRNGSSCQDCPPKSKTSLEERGLMLRINVSRICT